MHVKGVSALGESSDSNEVVFDLTSAQPAGGRGSEHSRDDDGAPGGGGQNPSGLCSISFSVTANKPASLISIIHKLISAPQHG